MTSTEVAIRQPNGVAVTERDVVDGWITVVGDVAKLSDHIADTDFVPKALRNRPAAIAACILTGRELGIGPMASLKSIHMVQGVPSLSAEYKRARALSAGHQIVIDDSTATRCTVRGRRAGAENWVTITWTMDMATRAKLSGKDVWKQYPQRMLQARATSELCDLLFPDASLGLETTEVLEDGGALVAAVAVEAAAETAAAEPAKPATAQRRRRQAEPKPDPTPAPPAAGSDSTAAPATGQTAPSPDLPPLPGEDEPEPEIDKDAPGSVSKSQLTKLGAIFTEYGFKAAERQQRLTVASQIVGRELDSSSDLSLNEARALIDTLESCGSRDKLIALMNGVEDASDEPGGDD